MAQTWYETYDNFIAIYLVGENNMGGAPSTSTLEAYADGHGWTYPVVADPGYAYYYPFVTGTFYLPSQTMLGPGLEILMTDGTPSANMIESNLPE